jgi:HAMP domain-containing protein
MRSGHARFFIVFLFFTIGLIVYRSVWISKALTSKAEVFDIELKRKGLRRYPQYYPLVTYKTINGEIQTSGTANLPVKIGDSVDILYDPVNVTKFRINTPYWLWYDIWAWYRLILVLIGLYYIALFVIKRLRARNISRIRHLRDSLATEMRYVEMNVPHETYTDKEQDPVITKPITKSSFSFPRITLTKLQRIILGSVLVILPFALILTGLKWNVPYVTPIGVIILMTYFGLITSRR